MRGPVTPSRSGVPTSLARSKCSGRGPRPAGIETTPRAAEQIAPGDGALAKAAESRAAALHHGGRSPVARPPVEDHGQVLRTGEDHRHPARPGGRRDTVPVGAGHRQGTQLPAQGPDHRVVGPPHPDRVAGRRRSPEVGGEGPSPRNHQGQRTRANIVRPGARPHGRACRPRPRPGPGHPPEREGPLRWAAPSTRRAAPPPGAGRGRPPTRRPCRWARPPPLRSGGPWPPAPGTPASTGRGNSLIVTAAPPPCGPGRPGRVRCGRRRTRPGGRHRARDRPGRGRSRPPAPRPDGPSGRRRR